jgi:hypothetical protein
MPGGNITHHSQSGGGVAACTCGIVRPEGITVHRRIVKRRQVILGENVFSQDAL